MKKQIVIIGAGASGLFAAIHAAKNADNQYNIKLIDAADKAAKKICVTGNGRCNLTNEDMGADKYYCENPDFVKRVLGRFSYQDIIKELQSLGIFTKSKKGYIYPNSEQAQTIASGLISACRLLGVEIMTGYAVDNILYEDNIFHLSAHKESSDTSAGITLMADKLIIATGSNASVKQDYTSAIMNSLVKLGHTTIEFKPALCPVFVKMNQVSEKFFKSVAGVRSDIKCSLKTSKELLCEQNGELQITEYGLSGIVIFCLSGIINRLSDNIPKYIYVDFLPNLAAYEILELFRSQLCYEKRSLLDLFSGILNNKLAGGLLYLYSELVNTDIKAFHKNVPEAVMADIITFMKHIQFEVSKTHDIQHSQVCSGGICLNNINADTMESKIIKNLYFSGECMDVDGICGGYNLQWAWSTGYIAGRSSVND